MNTATLKSAFDALQYVTNPYALFGFFFLLLIVVLSFVRGVKPVVRFIVTAILCVVVIVLAYLFLQSTLNKVRQEVLIHAIKDNNQRPVAGDIRIQLMDIDTLKRKVDPDENPSGHEYNKTKVGKTVMKKVLETAGLLDQDMDTISQMSQQDWDAYLDKLPKDQSKRVKDIPFVRFAIYRGQTRLEDFETKRYFKNDEIEIPVDGQKPLRLQLVNVYNTKNNSSGEFEAVTLRLISENSF